MTEPDNSLPSLVVMVGQLLERAMTTQWVVLIVVPALITIFAIFIKRAAKSERKLEPFDKVFGFDLGVTACLTLMVSGFVLINRTTGGATLIERQHYIVGLFIVLAFFVAILIGAAAGMNKWGWKSADGIKTTTGVAWVINFIGIGMLVAAFVLTGGTFQ